MSPDPPPDDAATWVHSRVGASGYRTDVQARSHDWVADEPVPAGGTDAGPTPYELLLSALGSCTAMTLRFYAKRKGWPLESVHVALRSGRSHEKDCENCATQPVGISHVDRKIEMTGPLTDVQKAKLLEIADRCPIKQTLQNGIHVTTVA